MSEKTSSGGGFHEAVDASVESRKVFLHAGMIFSSLKPHVVVTVLGSCVSVCLWDSGLRAGGINHYLVPFWNGEGLMSPRYGNVAIRKLISKMLSLGGKREALVAKVFGGASLMTESTLFTCVGERNIALALDVLAQEGIPIVKQDVGGKSGRRIVFDTQTGSVLMKRIPHIQR
ncbi:MAG: chemotaxis protein CheD [Nitrospirota bacterium]|jgi:chemotaxis protein CheD